MTSLRTLSRLGLILIALLALAAAVSRSALADGPESEPGDLGLTQISGTLPEPETEGTAFIQWRGGTLYQLTARLAVNGCDVNLLWVWDSNTRRYTAGYTFDGPSFLNNNFNNLYKDNIPPSVIWVKCIDMINHVYGYGLLTDEEKKKADAHPKGVVVDFSGHEVFGIFPRCGDLWQQKTRDYVFPILPIPQKTCLKYADGDGGGLYNHGLSKHWGGFWNGSSMIYYFNPYVAVYRNKDALHDLHKEWHELCHANQYWNLAKYNTNSDFLESSNIHPNDMWHISEQGLNFIEYTGYQKNEQGEWFLPSNSSFNTLYDYFISDPRELSAEMCAGYLMTKAQLDQGWIDFHKPYLTDEAVEWLEKYVFVLPESRLAR